MINRVVLVGRLTRDPELRKTPSGASVCSYTLAVSRNRSAQPGQPEADFINCVTWNRQAETMAQYLHKGSLIGVEGRIQTRSYDNQQGQRVYVTEVLTDSVQFLESKKSSDSSYQQQRPAQPNNAYSSMNSYAEPSYTDDGFGSFDSNDALDIASDDLPF
ncbi:MAG: single-stranded DNA-binding protein [Erysipelotrichaceae bacterium]|uniref:single-stranded DNA-binding protein n=1 Tax=Floccifex sp. TaxID=2815810 RepID=UPI002A765F79|nr:single-stranded DNA-binding protein [Floccifex sp.]MDD7280643.1 single-stranded DNA-binding protein [Erysipelotrichaceae bacterium]MDY2958016.1 single-stranded DNA-binding protein [Floccifex sp.]